MRRRTSTCSMPLRNGITRPPPSASQGTRSSASISCVFLTAIRQTSTGLSKRVADRTETWKSPNRWLSTRRPPSTIAREVFSLARISTELPARANKAASSPPMPPGPSTAKFSASVATKGSLPFRRAGCSARSNRQLGFLIHQKSKNVRPRVVPGDVQVELAARDLIEIKIGEQRLLAVPGRARQDLAERPDDATTSATQDVIGVGRESVGNVRRKVVSPGELIARQNEAAALHSHVSHRRQPGLASVRRGGAVDLNTLCIHRHAQERHVVLPADVGANPADRCVEDGHCRAVAEAPDQTFRRCRHQLSVFAQVATGREEQDGAIEGAAVALDDRDHHVVGVLSSDPGEPVHGWAAHVHRRFKVALEMLPTLGGAVTDYGPERHPFRIAR